MAKAQHDFQGTILTIDSLLQEAAEKYPQERIITVTDKQEYLAGETIWAAIYLYAGSEPSFISKTVYAELVSPAGKIIAKKMLHAENGFAHVDITIPGATPSGVYALNVYTQWMKNFSSPVCQLPVFISGHDYINSPFVFSFRDEAVSKAEIIPEGGSLVPGTAANFTIRLSGKNNLPVSDTFTITENDLPVAAGRTKKGLASIAFAYHTTKKYQLKSGGFVQPFSLNRITGVHLQVNTAGKTKLFFSLDRLTAYPSDKFLLLGIKNNIICFNSVFSFSDGATTIPVNRVKLPDGVIDFYVLDEKEAVVACRPVYNKPQASSLISSKRINEKNEISFGGKIRHGLITVTAVNTATVQLTERNRLNLLHTETALQKESPFFIAANADDTALQLTDQLLCMQSTDMLGKKWALPTPSLQYMAESGISLKGKVTPFAGKGGDKGYHVELFVRGEDSSRLVSRANALPSGEFSVMDLVYKKQALIYFQGHNPKNANELMKVEIQPSYFDTLKQSAYLLPVNFPKELLNKQVNIPLRKKLDSLLATDTQYRPLQAVVVKTKQKTKTDSIRQEYLSPLFDDGSAQLLIPEGQQFVSIWHYLRSLVPGLTITGDLLNPESVSFSRYSLLPRVNNTGEDVEMDDPEGIYFFLNEIQVRADVISSIHMEDVALITVSKQPAAALGAYNGYISVYTKKGLSFDAGLKKQMASVKREGYSLTRNGFIAEDWRPLTASTIFTQVITPDSKPFTLRLSPEQTYRILISGRDEKGNFLVEEKITGTE